MKKVAKSFLLIVASVVTSLAFVACDNDDNNDANVDLRGKWMIMSDNYKELLIINANHSFVSTGANDQRTWTSVEGTIALKGNHITLDIEEGDHIEGTYTLADNKLTLVIDGTTREYSKMIEEFSMTGTWESTKSLSFIKAVKDEIKLPIGSIVNGEVIPVSFKTDSIKGEFIDKAIKTYLRNVEFKSNGEMTYNVVKEGKEVQMKKNYTLANNMLRITGEIADIDIDNMFMIFQNANQNESYLFLTKENVGAMFVGYAMMLRAGNVSEGTEEALNAFANEFMETFENFATIIYLKKK